MNLQNFNPPIVVKEIVNLFNAGYSPIVLVCGKPRVSKTSKAFLWANLCSKLIWNKNWDWKKGTIVDVDELLYKLDSETEIEEIILMDEVQRQLKKKNWYKPQSKLMSDLISSQAYKHYIIFLILPKAWELGTEHASSVNFVLPCHSRSLVQPYRSETPYWDIALQKKIPKKHGLGHFYWDYKREPIKSVFKDELTQLPEFLKYIEEHLKKKIVHDAIEEDIRNKRERGFKEREQEVLRYLGYT